MSRKIIHLDMDCFYAAVEIRDFPFLRGKALAVGSSSRRGVLTTCNYEARKFGCHSAMPTYEAIELCPELIVVPTRFDVYRKEAEKIRAIMAEFSAIIEPLSLDEAFLDVSDSERYAWDIAKDLRKKIFNECGLTASAGIAPNKLLAKIASDWKKPNGQFAVQPDEIEAFIKPLPVNKLWGIGPKSTAKLHAEGIKTCADVQKLSAERLEELFGNFGKSIYKQARGIDDRPVESFRMRKSLSTERTYDESLVSDEECIEVFTKVFDELKNDVKKKAEGRKISKLFVRLKFDDFQKTTRECLGDKIQLSSFQSLLSSALGRRQQRCVRLIGAGVRFEDESEPSAQLEFDFS